MANREPQNEGKYTLGIEWYIVEERKQKHYVVEELQTLPEELTNTF